mmetsp:Transcript_16380/g.24811  ORF Transcript_16380/g.24811 Transcript_16380/m.24811 type:complete len:236 (-) Transcript_16380:10-717(-)
MKALRRKVLGQECEILAVFQQNQTEEGTPGGLLGLGSSLIALPGISFLHQRALNAVMGPQIWAVILGEELAKVVLKWKLRRKICRTQHLRQSGRQQQEGLTFSVPAPQHILLLAAVQRARLRRRRTTGQIQNRAGSISIPLTPSACLGRMVRSEGGMGRAAVPSQRRRVQTWSSSLLLWRVQRKRGMEQWLLAMKKEVLGEAMVRAQRERTELEARSSQDRGRGGGGLGGGGRGD